jgi:hypothetical protein
MADQDSGHLAGSREQMTFSRPGEDRLLRFSEAQREVRKTLESGGIKGSDDLFR